MALADLLAQLPEGLDYVSLQNDVRDSDGAALASGRVRHFGEGLNDFTDTAALASHMDVVVSVCTAGAHLAGALGKDTRGDADQHGNLLALAGRARGQPVVSVDAPLPAGRGPRLARGIRPHWA